MTEKELQDQNALYVSRRELMRARKGHDNAYKLAEDVFVHKYRDLKTGGDDDEAVHVTRNEHGRIASIMVAGHSTPKWDEAEAFFYALPLPHDKQAAASLSAGGGSAPIEPAPLPAENAPAEPAPEAPKPKRKLLRKKKVSKKKED